MAIFYLWISLFAFHQGLLPSVMASPPQVNVTEESLTRQATFIFKGTVVKLNATTMSAVRASESTAVVRIDEVIDAPGAPPDLAGKEITVQLREPGSIRAAQQMFFFTKGWLLGNSMAVIEVGRLGGSQSAQQISEAVRATRQKMADEELQGEMVRSEVIVVGRVSSVRPSKAPHIGSEHDPDWYEAQITVESVVRGNLPARTTMLLFPHSDDVMWKASPKFKEGQQGIWLLHRNQARLSGIEDQFTALKSIDFQTVDQHERVLRLVKTLE